MGQQSVHHAARIQRSGAPPEVARPARLTSRRQRRRERDCRKTIGHCWHPASGMGVDWWCCECSGETDGTPPDRCVKCRPAAGAPSSTPNPYGQTPRTDSRGRRIPPSQDGPVVPLPPAGPTRVQVEHVGEPAAERMIRRPERSTTAARDWVPPTQDVPHPPPPPAGPARVQVALTGQGGQRISVLDAVQLYAQELRDRYRLGDRERFNVHVPSRGSVDPDEVAEWERAGGTVTYEEDNQRPQPESLTTAARPGRAASERHVAQLCAVAANMPGPDHPTDPERALAGWKVNVRQIADQVAAEAWHAGAAWGLPRQAPGAYVVVTEREYERIRDAARLPPDAAARSASAEQEGGQP